MSKKTILHLLFLLALSGALIYLTKSFWMSVGIMMLLLLIDSLLLQYDNRRRREWEERHSINSDESESDSGQESES